MKIRKDKHGPYVRTDGHVFRPYPAYCSQDSRQVKDGHTALKVGQEVKAHHIEQSPHGRIRADDIIEIWCSHGPYFGKSTTDCWCPNFIKAVPKYPEHDKLNAVKDKSQIIGEFLDWLPRYGVEVDPALGPLSIAYYPLRGNGGMDGSERREVMYDAPVTIEKLLAGYFGIDLKKLEAEKRQILDELRTVNK